MFTVYLLRSTSATSKTYIGYTKDDMATVLDDHNKRKFPATKLAVPWEIDTSLAFKNEAKAKAFHAYLQHGSGLQLAKRFFQ